MRRLARHFATEKYYRRPVAGDGIVGLPSERFGQFIER